MLPVFQSLAGLIVIPLMVWAWSENRKASVNAKAVFMVVGIIAVQFALALLLFKVPQAKLFFDALSNVVAALQAATDQGTQLVFGYLAGGPAPFDATNPQNGFVLAFKVLPLILVLSAIVRILYYWGLLQRFVGAVASVLARIVGVGGALATAAAASIVLGTIEAPLLIRPYLKTMGRGALFATMVVVMSTVAGTVMALYAGLLNASVPGAAGHLVAASLMNVPGALMLARLSVPDGFNDEASDGVKSVQVTFDDAPQSTMDALAQGVADGIQLVVSVAAMLIVVVALVALVNIILGQLPSPFEGPITLQLLLGYAFAPLALLIGIPTSEVSFAGALLGQKLILNEFLAYLSLSQTLAADPSVLSERSRLIMTYALCGFANLGSLGILVGGLTAMVPERRDEIVRLAPRAVGVGFLTTLLTASIIGCIIWP
ncbi:MAG: nucleoside transporter C-terminal domain-containing protein [Pseudomonadota bacterium]